MDNIEIVTLRKVVIDSIMEKLDTISDQLNQKNDYEYKLLKVQQAAEITEYDVQTIYSLLKLGKLKNHGIGHTKRVNKQELIECFKNNAK